MGEFCVIAGGCGDLITLRNPGATSSRAASRDPGLVANAVVRYRDDGILTVNSRSEGWARMPGFGH